MGTPCGPQAGAAAWSTASRDSLCKSVGGCNTEHTKNATHDSSFSLWVSVEQCAQRRATLHPVRETCPVGRSLSRGKGGLTCPSAACSQRHFLGTTPNHSPAAPDTPTVSIDCARPEPITFGTATLTRLAVRSVAEQLLEHALPHLPFTRRVHLVRREGRDVSS